MNLNKLSCLSLAVAALMLLASCSSDKSSDPGDNNNNNSTASAVAIADFAFAPSSITVKVGTTVKWTNNDAAPHTVTSDNGGFTSSGNLTNGQSYQVTFTQVGNYPYHCAIHPSMTGSVTVTE